MAQPASLVLGRGLLVTFALPGVLQGFMNAPATSMLQGIYAKHAGVGLIALGGAVLFVRLFDCLSDVLIGYWSDRTAGHRHGRKPWIVAGTVVTLVALWFLYRPPPQVTATYYGAWFLLANIGWSLVEIPYRSWSLELSRDYVQRSRVQVWIAMFTILGAALFYSFPALAKALGQVEGTDFNLQTLAFAAVFVVVTLPLLNLFMLVRVPVAAPAAVPAPPARESLREIVQSVIGNTLLLRFIGCFSLAALLGGLPAGVTYLFMDNYLGLGQQLGAIMMSTLPATLLGVPFWGWAAARFARQRVWGFSLMLCATAYALLGLVEPGGAHTATAVGLVYSIALFCLVSVVVIGPAILGDIADYGKLRFGKDRTGTYLAVYTQVLKGITAVAAGLGLTLLGWAGFDATRSGAELEPGAVTALRWLVCWLPALGMFLTGGLVWRLPLGRAEQAQVAAALQARETAVSSPPP